MASIHSRNYQIGRLSKAQWQRRSAEGGSASLSRIACHALRCSLLKTIQKRFWLGLLTLFLVTTLLPVAAQHSPPTIQNPTPSTRLEQGKTFYEAGQFSQAVSFWQQAAQGYDTQGDRLNTAISLNYLALAQQELGQWQEAQKAMRMSLELLHNLELKTQSSRLTLAQALNTQGSLQLAMGQTEAALNTWKQAAIAYANASDEAGILGSEINQAQALQTLGLYRRAQTTLEQVNTKLQAQPDSLLKATGLQSLGVALQIVGDLQKSQEVLEQSLAMQERVGSSLDTSATLFSLGNTARALQDYQKALFYYHKAAEKATNPTTKLEAQLNQLSLRVQITNQSSCASLPSCQEEQAGWKTAPALLSQIQSQLTNLPPSRAVVYAQVNFAESLSKMATLGVLAPQPSEIARMLGRAVRQARMLKDARAESYALGELGHLYELGAQWADAQTLTQESLSLAQAINADAIAYRWQWQLGRILKAKGNVTPAVTAYTEAVNTLQSLRSDLVAINPDIQFSFRETVEPVYRELVELLLQPSNSEEIPSQKNLQKALHVIESLQIAELDNFFREACLTAKAEQINQVDPTAAVIYPIILPDRLAVIFSLPGQPLRYSQTQLPQSEVESILDQLLQSLSPVLSNKQRLRLSQQVYDWLIRPAETKLAQSEVKTLVFVLDGALRNLPMAALHDGKQYLVEKYSIALSPGLQLLQPRSLNRERLKVLTGGLSEPRQGFSSLPGVESELSSIATELPSKVLLNQQFVKTTLKTQINAVPFGIIHFATHGQFSSKAEDTFLLTWDGRINVKDLDELLQVRERENTNPIELLVLSACQTATGDKRAALGLAGLAVRSGARSTLATLWSVQDQSTAELMREFYQELLQTKVSKAEALRQAQLALLKKPKYQHPFYWAPFILVGNWL